MTQDSRKLRIFNDIETKWNLKDFQEQGGTLISGKQGVIAFMMNIGGVAIIYEPRILKFSRPIFIYNQGYSDTIFMRKSLEFLKVAWFKTHKVLWQMSLRKQQGGGRRNFTTL